MCFYVTEKLRQIFQCNYANVFISLGETDMNILNYCPGKAHGIRTWSLFEHKS